jgi:hypothetical protein
LVLKMMKVPSGLHEMLLALPFGIAVTGRLSPPASGTAKMLRNDRALTPM